MTRVFKISLHLLYLNMATSLFYFSLTYVGSYTNITSIDLLTIIGLIIFATITQYYLIKKHIIIILNERVTYTLFLFFNIYAVNLVFNEGLIKQPFKIEILLMSFGVLLLFAFISMFNELKKYQNYIISLIFLSALFFFYKPYQMQQSIDTLSIKYNDTLSVYPLTFKEKPNVYIIGIDALVPSILLKKHMNLESTDLHNLLNEEFITYKNVFSGGDRTIPSYLSMLSLTPDYWNSFDDSKDYCLFCPTPLNRNNLFNGLTPSPLIMIFKSNGYESTTAHEWPHFGPIKGPYIDNYLLRTRQDGKRATHSVCNLMSSRSDFIGFFGYCNLRNKLKFLKDYSSEKKLNYKGFQFNLAWDLQNIEEIAAKKAPQLYIGHILSTRHTSYEFDITNKEMFSEFKTEYVTQANKTAKLMKIVLDHIKKNDENALIYVWGDHGPVLSQHLSWDDRYDKNSSHPLVQSTKFFIQDRLGTFGGVYHDGSVCNSEVFQTQRRFNTPQHILKDILYCLSNSKSRDLYGDYFKEFTRTKTFAFPRRGQNKPILADIVEFEDYLYE